MRALEIPELKFGQWVYWADRDAIDNISFPGIYVLAITSEDLTNKPVEYSQVVYIGMSNSLSGVKGRLYQLNRSITGLSGHSGGNSIRKYHGVYDFWEDNLDLYVAVCPVICNVAKRSIKDLKLMGAVSYMEYEAFSLFKKYCPKQNKPKFNTR
ncbi:hypothetical protein [Aliivibrio sp. EL58]|uniref:hypothetical protein n=1 Tax=Aliivibrio sp. EL58 TaxID=2107582 RepID=UPI000EFC1522|nr:hypothetical protein [Aliivibrio sp. EL58]